MYWSAIIVTRNQVNTCVETVESILNQTVPPDVCVVVEDGSTDGAGDVLDVLAAEHSNLEVIHTGSTTRDYGRLPTLWNMGLSKAGPHKYHFMTAGDCVFEPDHITKLLTPMEADDEIVHAGGMIAGETGRRKPHGSDMVVREEWLWSVLGTNKYPVNLVYEVIPYYYALMHKKKVLLERSATFKHLDKYGGHHKFGEWGAGMRAMGYHPVYAIGRCLVRRRMYMLWNYLTFRPRPNTFWDYAPSDIRKFIREYQRRRLKSYVRQVIAPRAGGTPV